MARSHAPTELVALCRNGEQFSLRRQSLNTTESSTHVATVSAMVDQDPFPGFTMAGNDMIWVKDYGENAGLLEELERARFVQSVGRTIKQGFVAFPLCVVLLAEKEMLQTCAKCEAVERLDAVERYKRCGRCKRRYYCSSEHQSDDWLRHKIDCKDLARLDFVSVENRKRRREVEVLERGRCEDTTSTLDPQAGHEADDDRSAKIVEI
ncbi:hypothetical protein JCM3766R1_002334 [Sporobolomyces carnicolor]